MALISNWVAKQGVDLAQAYHKIIKIYWEGIEFKNRINLEVNVYVSEEIRRDPSERPPVEILYFEMPLAEQGSGNLVSQAYGWLKTLPSYEGAQDA